MALGHFREHPDEESIRPIANTRACGRSSMDGLGRAPDRSSPVLLATQLIPEEALEAEVHDKVGRGASGKWPSTGGGRRGTGSLEPARSGRRCPARRGSSPGGEVALTSSSGFRALYDFAAEGGAGITAFVGVMDFEVLRVGTGWMASGA